MGLGFAGFNSAASLSHTRMVTHNLNDMQLMDILKVGAGVMRYGILVGEDKDDLARGLAVQNAHTRMHTHVRTHAHPHTHGRARTHTRTRRHTCAGTRAHLVALGLPWCHLGPLGLTWSRCGFSERPFLPREA